MKVLDRHALPPVLLLHGMCCTGSSLQALRTTLARLGLRVEAPSLGGAARGAGTQAPYGLDDLFAEAIARAEALRTANGFPPVVVGHSNGGLLALALAARGLATAAVLVAPAPVPSVGGAPAWLRRLIARRMFGRGWQDRWVELSPGTSGLLPPALAGTLAADSGHAMSDVLHACRKGPFDPAPALACPLAIVSGGKDRMVPAFLSRRMAKRFGARLDVLPKADHWLIWDRQAIDRIALIVGGFVGAAASASARDSRASGQNVCPDTLS